MLGPLYTSLSSALHIMVLFFCAGSYLKLRTITLLVLFWWKFNETKTNTKIQTRTVSGVLVQLSGTILACPVLRHHQVMWPDIFLDEIILLEHQLQKLLCFKLCSSLT